MTILIPIIIIAGWVWIMVRTKRAESDFLKIPTREEYLAAHPDCLPKPGRLLCHLCRSEGVYMRSSAQGFGNIHQCRSCGAPLYRSERGPV
jgi:hypothetical protein